jgi:hypothetical protein
MKANRATASPETLDPHTEEERRRMSGLVLRLRLTKRVEELVERAFGSVGDFQAYLNGNSAWMFQQEDVKFLNGKRIPLRMSLVLLCGRVKLVLSPPVITGGDSGSYFNRVFAVVQPNRSDRTDALAGREVQEPIEIEPDLPIRPPIPTTMAVTKTKEEPAQETTVTENVQREADVKPPEAPAVEKDRQRFSCPNCSSSLIPERGMFCSSCGFPLPDNLGVHREIVVAIRPSEYRKLAEHLRQELNVAWSQLKRGRKVDETASIGVNIFLLTVADEKRASTLVDEKRFDELLGTAGIGRVTSDPYEIREAHKMLASAEKPTQ